MKSWILNQGAACSVTGSALPAVCRSDVKLELKEARNQALIWASSSGHW